VNQPLPPADVLAGDAAALVRELAAAGAPTPPNLSRGELLQAVLALRLARGEPVAVAGALDLMPEGFGFVRSPAFDFAASPHDAFVAPSQVQALNLKAGQWLAGPLRAPRGAERFFGLVRVDTANGAPPAQLGERLAFASRAPAAAQAPLGGPHGADWRRGQRVLLLAPPGAPTHRWFAAAASGLAAAAPPLRVRACLLDQRPEDLAAAKAAVGTAAELVGTTFDAPPERHVALAELALARCQREVEAGADVVLLVDGLTTLALAAQRALPSSGRWICPGLDVQAAQPGKRLFAAARACAEGGSLTVIARVDDSGGSAVEAAVRDDLALRAHHVAALRGDGAA
jgi:transcription termination factor Rho